MLRHLERTARRVYLATQAENANDYIDCISTATDHVVYDIMELIDFVEGARARGAL